jgi:hypothetical protein
MAQTLIIPGVRGEFVAGLAWRTHAQPPKSEAIRAWSVRSGRWGVTYKTGEGHTQVGLCDPVSGVDSPGRLKSLAASVAGQQVAPWRAIYELGNGRFWYVAVRDRKAIIPDGDQIGTRNEIERAWDDHTRLGNWNELTEGTVDDIADMLSAAPATPSLQDMQARASVRFVKTYASKIAILFAIVLAAAFLLGRVLGYGVKHRHAEQPRAITLPVKLPPVVTRPWVDEPMPSQAIDACHRIWSGKHLDLKGWNLVSWTCALDNDGIAINKSWSRTYGRASDAPGTLSPTGQSSAESEKASARFQKSPDMANSIDVAEASVRDFAQVHGYTLTIGAAAAKPELPTFTLAKDTSPWTSSHVTINVPWAPWLGLAASFDRVSGLRIRSVTWNSEADQWLIAGELYGLNRPHPEGNASSGQQTVNRSKSQTKRVRHENP